MLDESLSNEAASKKRVLLRTAKLGICEDLEKEYFRLTSLPSASSVRPPNVLALALDLVSVTMECEHERQWNF